MFGIQKPTPKGLRFITLSKFKIINNYIEIKMVPKKKSILNATWVSSKF